MRFHITGTAVAVILVGSTVIAAAQATTGDQNSGVDARSHPSTTTSTQSSKQSGADLGTGMSPANNNPSVTGHDNSGMRTDAATNPMHSTAHRRHHNTSHTTTPTMAPDNSQDTTTTPPR